MTPPRVRPSSPIRPPARPALAISAASMFCLAAFGVAGLQPENPPAPPPPKQVEPPVEEPVAPEAEPQPGEPAEADSDRETEIVMRDGRRLSGDLVERTETHISLSIGGVVMRFPMAEISMVRVLPSVEERYEALRRSIDPEDVEGLLRLAEWLRARGRFDLALTEIERALAVEPLHPDARQLKLLVTEQKKLAAVPPSDAERPRPGNNRSQRPDFPLLNDHQINLIRVYEIDLKDPPRLLIDRDTVTKVLDQYAGVGEVPVTREGRDAFYRKRPEDILAIMFDLQARDLYGEVRVMGNPDSMRLFRDRVHRTWLINSCATNQCHGGEEAGRLRLYNRSSGSDAAVYTNFLILDRFRTSDGLPLIDYLSPARSPLLHMGLNRDDALFKHPEVDRPGTARWRPVFRDPDSERFKEALEWIGEMYKPRPNYPIEYQPPGASEPAADQGPAEPQPR